MTIVGTDGYDELIVRTTRKIILAFIKRELIGRDAGAHAFLLKLKNLIDSVEENRSTPASSSLICDGANWKIACPKLSNTDLYLQLCGREFKPEEIPPAVLFKYFYSPENTWYRVVLHECGGTPEWQFRKVSEWTSSTTTGIPFGIPRFVMSKFEECIRERACV